MSAGTDKLKEAFRDFETSGVPATGPNEPDKGEIRIALDRLSIDIAAASTNDPQAVIDALTDAYGRLDEIDMRGVVGTGTVGDREAYTYRNGGSPAVPAGAVWLRKEPDQALRIDVWVLNGQAHPGTGVAVTADGWYSLKNQAEMDNMSLGKTGVLPEVNVGGLDALKTGIDELAKIQFADFRATALTNDPEPVVNTEWGLHGVMPSYQLFSWAGFSVRLGGGVRHFRPKDWNAAPALTAIGDSMVEKPWVAEYAATIGLPLNNVAKYSSGAKQPYRLGTRKLYFTTTGNAVPASGGSVLITSINGEAPNADAGQFAANAFLNTNTGDPVATNCSVTGYLGDRHGTVSVPNGGTATYTFVPDDGRGATTISPQTLFVPDNLARLKTDELLIRMSQNYWYADDETVFPNNINMRVIEDIDAILAETTGQRIIIMGLTAQQSFGPPGSKVLTALAYFNNLLRTRYPQYYEYFPGVGGNYDYIRANGSNGTTDVSYIENGVMPQSCMDDDIHFNTKGQGVEKDGVLLYRNTIQALPPAIIKGTTQFKIEAFGVNPRNTNALYGSSVTSIEVDYFTADIYARLAALETP